MPSSAGKKKSHSEALGKPNLDFYYVISTLDRDNDREGVLSFYFFFNDTPTTEIYTLSLHDALPISRPRVSCRGSSAASAAGFRPRPAPPARGRSEEHTSELQSQFHLVCRLLLEKKKKTMQTSDAKKKKKKRITKSE